MSNPELLAARKELLSMKAELQRMELSMHIEQAKASLSWAKMLTGSVGQFLRTPKINAMTTLLGTWFKRYPMLATVGSVVFANIRKPLAKAGFRASLMAVITGGVYWWLRRDSVSARRAEAYQQYQRQHSVESGNGAIQHAPDHRSPK